MKLELLNLRFSSDINSPAIQAEFSEGIYRVCSANPETRHKLLAYLTAQSKPLGGEIHFLDYDIHMLGDAYRNHLSYYSQHPWKPKTISLINYLTENALSQRLPLPAAQKKVDFTLQELGIQGRWYTRLREVPPKVLPRILLYQTVLSEAPIIILDEDELPIPGTDDYNYLRELFLRLSDTKIIILLTDLPSQYIIQADPLSPIKEDPFPDLPLNVYVLPV